jgi:hypothetical protein
MRHPMRLFLRMLAMPSGPTDPPETLVAIPAPAVLLLLGTVWVAILMMMAMLALEIVILIQVFEVVDLLDKLVLFG